MSPNILNLSSSVCELSKNSDSALEYSSRRSKFGDPSERTGKFTLNKPFPS
uniref:Uncharacterized protein n=1 Tax=Podoviridae sp. ct8Lf7 TaxID=2827723 RepID=A0A8S5S1Q6_9CAUD|nr:MAG TPA: hypothetical protein [Podoviridae sp. ct8Lf7]